MYFVRIGTVASDNGTERCNLLQSYAVLFISDNGRASNPSFIQGVDV